MTEAKTRKKASKPETPDKKRYKRRKTRLGFGARGRETLKLAYQLGGMTAEQHSRLFGVDIRRSYRLLGKLADQRLLEQGPIETPGRPKDFHYLSKLNGSRGILLGGYEADVRQREVLPGYKRFQLPQTVEHRHVCNEYYLALREDAAKRAKAGEDVEVPLWSMRGESHPGFPLLGEGTPNSKRSDARTVYERVYPDGIFEIRFGEGADGLKRRYLLEYESRSRPEKVLQKIDAYGAYFARRLEEDGETMEDWLMPVIFLFSRSSTAVLAAGNVATALEKKRPELGRYLGWRAAAKARGIRAGRLVLFASMETIEVRGALGIEYAASEVYPEDQEGVGAGGGVVDLEAVAEELEEVLTPDEQKERS